MLDRFPDDRPVPLEQFLDDLPVPVMIMDGDAVIGFANRQAQLLLNQTAEQIAGNRGGDVFLCSHARQPGGCGHTVHCSGCTIRACVLKTHLTGEPQVMVPAALKTGNSAAPMPVAMTITTVKRGSSVLLLVNGCDEAEAEPEIG
jgi:nitrogen fixation/metabolism regulation signal transduction histidine kinase